MCFRGGVSGSSLRLALFSFSSKLISRMSCVGRGGGGISIFSFFFFAGSGFFVPSLPSPLKILKQASSGSGPIGVGRTPQNFGYLGAATVTGRVKMQEGGGLLFECWGGPFPAGIRFPGKRACVLAFELVLPPPGLFVGAKTPGPHLGPGARTGGVWIFTRGPRLDFGAGDGPFPAGIRFPSSPTGAPRSKLFFSALGLFVGEKTPGPHLGPGAHTVFLGQFLGPGRVRKAPGFDFPVVHLVHHVLS